MKFSSLLNLIFIVVTFAGVFRCYQLQSQLKQIHNEIESLSLSYGDFSQQKSLPQIVRLKTNDPMVFQWRVYLPPGYSGVVSDRISRTAFSRPLNLGHDMPWSYPSEILITQKFEVNHGEAQPNLGPNFKPWKSIRTDIQCTNWAVDQTEPVSYVSGQGRGGRRLATSARAEFVLDHWDEIVLAPNEAGNSSVIEDEVNLLQVTIPEELMEEYLDHVRREGSRPRENENVLKDLYLKIKKN